MIHLDTSFLIHALRAGSHQEQQLVAWLSGSEQLGVSAFAWAEFLCGPVSPAAAAHALELLGQPVPIHRAIAEKAAELFNGAGRRRGSLADCLIAAAAIESGAALATENRNDFARFLTAGLVLAE
ncbi:MAG TPA: PIN domain-containing protein [Vicinamibacterales bacterium]|nr:PIN domain-containing protein [Vicinamibacterales bacterium]